MAEDRTITTIRFVNDDRKLPGDPLSEADEAKLRLFDELVKACEAAERCLQSVERNEETIFRALLHSKEPAVATPFLTTSRGQRRNLEHARKVLARARELK